MLFLFLFLFFIFLSKETTEASVLVFYRRQTYTTRSPIEGGTHANPGPEVRIGPETFPPSSLHHESLPSQPATVCPRDLQSTGPSPSDPFNPDSGEFITCQRSTRGSKAALNRKEKKQQNAGTLRKRLLPRAAPPFLMSHPLIVS